MASVMYTKCFQMFSLDFKLSEIIQISKSIDKSPKTSRSVIYTNASQILVNLSNVFGIFKWSFLAHSASVDRRFWFYNFILHHFFQLVKDMPTAKYFADMVSFPTQKDASCANAERNQRK